MSPSIRPYRPADLDAIYDICVRTAAAGGDARGLYSSDRLVGDIFAVPYVTLEPEHAHVLDDGTGRVIGYILGTADTFRFVARFRDEWLRTIEGRYPSQASAALQGSQAPQSSQAEPQRSSADAGHSQANAGRPPADAEREMLLMLERPERMLVPELADYPAHLHIDLLPECQGRGFGRGMVNAFLAGLREAGVARVHLGMDPANTSARAFYDRLGFKELPTAQPGALYLGRTTEP